MSTSLTTVSLVDAGVCIPLLLVLLGVAAVVVLGVAALGVVVVAAVVCIVAVERVVVGERGEGRLSIRPSPRAP